MLWSGWDYELLLLMYGFGTLSSGYALVGIFFQFYLIYQRISLFPGG